MGLESRILPAATHALLESVINYGLAFTGSHVSTCELKKLATLLFHEAARKIVGTGITIRRVISFALTGIRTAFQHCVLRDANMLDGVLRADGMIAKRKARKRMQGSLCPRVRLQRRYCSSSLDNTEQRSARKASADHSPTSPP